MSSQGPKASDRSAAPSEPPRVWLRYGDADIELGFGETVVGRSPNSGIVLDDPLVSRSHARFVVQRGTVTLEDMGSANGVLVNGERLSRARVLVGGDRIHIGQQILQLFVQTMAPARAARLAARTLTGQTLPQLALGQVTGERSEPTRKGDAMDLLVGVTEKMLALGRGDEAERILGNFLRTLLTHAKDHRDVELPTAEKAASYAARIAEATGKGAWVDYIFELYTALRRPLPAGIIDRLYESVRKLSPVSVSVFREYLAVLRASEGEMGPADRFLLRRIEGLEAQGALK